MSSYRVAFPPLANPTWSEVVSRDLFDDARCDAVLALLDDERWAEAALAADYGGRERIDARIRSADIQLLSADGTWDHGLLMAALSEINAEHHRYDLTGLDPADCPSVIRYDAGTGGHFRPHVDVGPSNPTRKLSFIVQLTDPDTYHGGDLVFPELGLSAPRARGTLVAFPSFVTHVVTPIVSGTRHAIVSWVHGRTFR